MIEELINRQTDVGWVEYVPIVGDAVGSYYSWEVSKILPNRLGSIRNNLRAKAGLGVFSASTDLIGGSVKNIFKLASRKSFLVRSSKPAIKNLGEFEVSSITKASSALSGLFSKYPRFSAYLPKIGKVLKNRIKDEVIGEILEEAGEAIWRYLNEQSPEQIEKIFDELPKEKEKAVKYLKNLLNCSEFNALRPKALAAGMPANDIDAAIAKLCAIPTANTRQEISAELTSQNYSNAEVKAFLSDIIVNTQDNRHIAKNINANFGIEELRAWKKLHPSGFEIDFEYIRTLSYVPEYSVVVNGVNARNVSINSNKGKNWATFSGTTIHAVGGVGIGSTKENRNQILNIVPLIPNITYIVDEYVIYTTDNLGRVSRIEANLHLKTSERWDEEEQQRAKNVKDGKTSAPVDHGGHMIAAQFDGPVEQINYFPQDPNQNSFFGNPKEWFNMEMEWKRTLSPPQNSGIAPQSVSVDIRPQFQGNSKRPTEFVVDFWYNNIKQIQRIISN